MKFKGSLVVPGKKSKSKSKSKKIKGTRSRRSRGLKLKPIVIEDTIPEGKDVKFRLRFAPKEFRRIRRLLRRGAKRSLRITATATAAGSELVVASDIDRKDSRRRTVRLRAPKRRGK